MCQPLVVHPLSAILKTLAYHFSPPLMPDGALEEIVTRIEKLPFQIAGKSFGFELPLDRSHVTPDFGACVDPGGREFLLKEIPEDGTMYQNFGEAFISLCRKWSRDTAFSRIINNIWLEYDVPGKMSPLPPPGLFVTLNRRVFHNPGFPWALLELLNGDPILPKVKEQIEKISGRLSPPARIGQIGYFPSRDVRQFRLCIKGLTFDTLFSLLEDSGLWYTLGASDKIVMELSRFVDFPILHLDVGSRISTKTGIEFRLAGDDLAPHQQPRWFRFLEYLVEQGLCTEEKKAALVRWPGKSWEIHDPHLYRFATYRFLYYFKGVFSPGTPCKIKSYFGFVNSTYFLEKKRQVPREYTTVSYNRLTTLVKESLNRGVNFLKEKQLDSGEFRTYIAYDSFLETKVYDSSPFITSFILYALHFFPVDHVASLRSKALSFLSGERRAGSLWSYWSKDSAREIGPDMDDTCCISFILRTLNRDQFTGENVDFILKNRGPGGLFKTWFKPDGEPNDVDSVVNANVLLYLGEREETRTACDYLTDCIEKGGEGDSYWYYLNNISLYYMVSRAFYNGVSCFEGLGERIVEKIFSHQRTDLFFGNDLETAMALCALQNYDYSSGDLEKVMFRLMENQTGTGMWNSYPFYSGPEYPAIPNVWFGSEELTTGFCLEALGRFLL